MSKTSMTPRNTKRRAAFIASVVLLPMLSATTLNRASAESLNGRGDDHRDERSDDRRDERSDDRHSETVYTETNNASGNAVLAFSARSTGLSPIGSFATGGRGSGDGLGSQGAVVTDGKYLAAVNAGSNELSVFRLGRDGAPGLIATVPSGGVRPVSVTLNDGVAYVLNTGDETVNGFRLRNDHVDAIPGSHQQLAGAGAAQISFTSDGRQLLVTQMGTSTIEVLNVRGDIAQAPVVNPSAGITPFGFAVAHRDQVVVSNANGGAPGASSLSSYRVNRGGALDVVSNQVPTTQTAACWVVLAEHDRFAFTTNAGSGTISSYGVGNDGWLTLLQAAAGTPGAGPSDMAVSDDDLFTLAGGSHLITQHHIGDDGSLSPSTSVTVPVGVVGLASA